MRLLAVAAALLLAASVAGAVEPLGDVQAFAGHPLRVPLSTGESDACTGMLGLQSAVQADEQCSNVV